MSEWLTDTPIVARVVCLGCEPDADVTREVIDVRYCAAHTPVTEGSDDTVPSTWISGSVEAGGDDNRRFCSLLHRGRDE